MSPMATRLLGAAGASVALVLASCGGGANDKNTTPAVKPGARAAPTPGPGSCRVAAAAGPAGLPSGFPGTGMLTVTKVTKAGPSYTVEGYSPGGLSTSFDAWKAAVAKTPGYTVTFSEREKTDAEVFYKGEGRSGMVGLHADCSEPATTRVYITSRPV